jgi:predicted AAA+ superfamily ATPase
MRDVIVDYLKSNQEELINIKKLSEDLQVSYPTALKWISILENTKEIKITYRGGNKIINLK